MEKQFFKLLGKESANVEILQSDSVNKLILASCLRNGFTVYLLIKMFAVSNPQYNEDGVSVPDKHWKYFVPILVKASANREFVYDLYDMMSSTFDVEKYYPL